MSKKIATVILLVIFFALSWFLLSQRKEPVLKTDSPYTKEKSNYYDPKFNCTDVDHCKG